MPPKRKQSRSPAKRNTRSKTIPEKPQSKIPVDDSDSDDSDYSEDIAETESEESESEPDSDADEHGNLKGFVVYECENCECEECGDEDEPSQTPDYNSQLISLFTKIAEQELQRRQKDPLFVKINSAKISDDLRKKLLTYFLNDESDTKRREWIETIISVPTGVYTPLPELATSDVKAYFREVKQSLDRAVYGLDNVKEEIINYLAQCVATGDNSAPRVLALQGSAGVGKTKIVRAGISRALNRPMHTFSMGGIKDSSYFTGFEYTYVGSKPGAIADKIIKGGVMNPILFFDELDKISETSVGREVEDMLVHLTDPVQNHDFNDKYINEIPIDLSRAIIIFSFNDISRISPILLDRLHIVNIKSPSADDKIHIARDYLLPEVLQSIQVKREDFSITDSAYKKIIRDYCKGYDGVRFLKRCLETILLRINSARLLGDTLVELGISKKPIVLPVTITEHNVSDFLGSTECSEPKNPYMYI
jgi:ATP-dependent Lon protease